MLTVLLNFHRNCLQFSWNARTRSALLRRADQFADVAASDYFPVGLDCLVESRHPFEWIAFKDRCEGVGFEQAVADGDRSDIL